MIAMSVVLFYTYALLWIRLDIQLISNRLTVFLHKCFLQSMVLHNIWIWCKVYTYTSSAFINVWHITLIHPLTRCKKKIQFVVLTILIRWYGELWGKVFLLYRWLRFREEICEEFSSFKVHYFVLSLANSVTYPMVSSVKCFGFTKGNLIICYAFCY